MKRRAFLQRSSTILVGVAALSIENTKLFANTNDTLYDDWRLPNIKELRSLCNDTLDSPAVNSKFFPKVALEPY